MTKTPIIIIFQILITTTFEYDETCNRYSCQSSLSENICSLKSDDIISLKQCDIYKHCQFSENYSSSYCYDSTYDYNEKSYPGGICNKNSDCKNNYCLNGTCEIKDSCSNSEDCGFGKYCHESVCYDAHNENEHCDHDEECKNNLICYNNNCTKFFSLKKGSNVGEYNEFLCETGIAVNGICNSLKLINKESSCENECVYEDYLKDKITLKNKCNCTYSPEPEKRCECGNEDIPILWENYTNYIKKALEEENIKKCNVKEKRPSYCIESLKTNWTLKNNNNRLNKLYYQIKGYHRYDDKVPCAINIVNNKDFTPPKPKDGKFKCPMYNCGPDSKIIFDNITCAYSINPFNENGDEINVHLKNICEKGNKCNYQIYDTHKDYTYNSTCVEIPSSKTWTIKYAGEKCSTKNQCQKSKNYHDVGYCINGYCSGHIEGQNCTNNSDCHKGHFCNGLYCEKQRGEGKFCLDSFECLNYLGCLNNSCVQYYSLSNGTYLNASYPEKELCEMEIINEETNQCAQLTYTDEMNMKKNEDGFVECNVGELCNYTTGYYFKGSLVIQTKECVCGFSINGNAYCPIPQTVNKDDWKKYFKLKNKQRDNSCHTERRDKCNDEMSDNDLDELRYYERKTKRAHLFYKSSNCIIEILNSKFINVNMMLIIILFYIIY